MGSDPIRRAPDEVVRGNPRVDEAKLREAERLLAELRGRGLRPPPPSVISPYGQRLIRKAEEARKTT